MSSSKANEILGRLLLWSSALEDTRQQLELVRRATVGAEQYHVKAELERFHEAVRENKESISKELSSREARDMDVIFTKQYPRPFPTWEECLG